jgi:hypothetical protein
MSDGSATKGLRERLTGGTEDRLGRALSDLFENPLLNGALGRAADAREKAAQAQELAMGALNLPSAADIERLTRRLRSVSQRLEGIEDGVHRLGRTFPGQSIDTRLGAIEEQLKTLAKTLGVRAAAQPAPAAAKPARAAAQPTPAAAKPARAAAQPAPAAAKPARAVAKTTRAAAKPARAAAKPRVAAKPKRAAAKAKPPGKPKPPA